MARTVVGLFDNQGDAQAAQRDLQTAGFGQDRVALVTSGVARLAEMLIQAGVPREDAAIYDQGVQSGGALIVAQSLPDAEAQQVAAILDRYNVVDISARGQMAMETTQVRTTAGRGSFSNDYQGGERVIPIVEEQIRVGKREVESGGVRVATRVEEVPVQEQVTLRDEQVRVERVPVNRPVDPNTVQNLDEAFAPLSVEVRERDEVAVVAKEARVVEEVVIEKETQQRTETIQDTVRRTDVDVQEIQGQTSVSGVREVGGMSTQGGSVTTGEGMIERGASNLGSAVERGTGLDLDADGDVGQRDPRNNY